jgi:murein DD-endopeptidase MepM/ murein hydrolase activator NlpD
MRTAAIAWTVMGLGLLGALLAPLPGHAGDGRKAPAAKLAALAAGERAASAQDLARAAQDRVAALVRWQDGIAAAHRRFTAQSRIAQRSLAAQADRAAASRRVAASGLVGLLARQRDQRGDPRSSTQAGLVATAMGEPLVEGERDLAAALASLDAARVALAGLGTQRRLAELSLDRVGALAAQAQAIATEAGILAGEASLRLALAQAGDRRAELFTERLALARELSLAQDPRTPAVTSITTLSQAEAALPLLAPPSRMAQALRPNDMALPITGEILRQGLAGTEHGQRRRGVTLVATRDQPVLAPRPGTVAFAGTFRNFGLVLIIDHGHEYHSLMAGLSELWVGLDEIVGSGEPVGRIVTGADGAASLYFELRRGGEPVDPFPAMAGHEDKVRS